MKAEQMEQVAFQFEGGPRPGLHVCRISTWPPPDMIPADVLGRYVLEAYSQIPDGEKHPNVMRGATYIYKPREEN